MTNMPVYYLPRPASIRPYFRINVDDTGDMFAETNVVDHAGLNNVDISESGRVSINGRDTGMWVPCYVRGTFNRLS